MRTPSPDHFASSLALVLSLLGLFACGEDHEERHDDHEQDEHDHGATTLGRLTISDAESAAVHVVDLDRGDVTTLEVAAAGAYLSSDGTGRYAFLSHYEDDRFEVIDTGIIVAAHGDHFDVTRRPPKKHSVSIDGAAPTHVLVGNDHVAVYFDGDGQLALFPYDALRGTEAVTPEYVEANRPHHGVGVPFGAALLLTHAVEATEQDEEEGWLGGVPVGLTVRAWQDPSSIDRTISGCGHLHGEAVVEDVALFACDEGVLRVSNQGGEVVDELIPYPDDIEVRTWGLVHGQGDIVIGDSGKSLLHVDAGSSEVTLHTLPDDAERKAHAMSRDGTAVYVLDTSGRLHCLDAVDLGSCGEPIEIIEAAGAEDRPLVVAGADHVYVVDGRDGHLHTIDAAEWSLEDDHLELPGKPFSAALTGMIGESH